MSEPRDTTKRTVGWMGIHRGHRARPAEWLAEQGIFFVSLTAILMVFLIFVFVAREALPIVLGRMDSAAHRPALPDEQVALLTPDGLRDYLGLTAKEFAGLDKEAIQSLIEVRKEEAKEAPKSPDAKINGAAWRYLLGPHPWSDSATGDRYVWQPVGAIHKYNLVPLFIGTLKTTAVALLFAVPVALAAAIYVSQLARPTLREWLKPAVELLAGVPSVVLGFFGLMVMASFLQRGFGYESRLNAFVAGIALGLAVIPVVFSIAEDALTSVPRAYSQAALALGASKWQAAWQIVLPAAAPGVFAAVVLGFGRAIGETMVVLMASGNASIVSWSLFDSTRSITATIAAELAEAVFGGHHYRILFLIGALLFVATFLTNLAGDLIMHRLKDRLEGKR